MFRTIRRKHRRRSCGYILEQLLITLLICAFLIPVAAILLSTLARMTAPPADYQDELGLVQLRHVINVSRDFVCTGSELSFVHHDARQRLALRNGNLDLLDPGTQIFLSNLSDASFSITGDLIYVTYAHPDRSPETRCLGHI